MEETSGLCGKRILPPLGTGSRVKRFTQIYADKRRRLPRIGVMGVCFRAGWLFPKRLDLGSSHPTGSLPIRRGPRLARDDTIYGLSWSVSGLVLVFGLDVCPYSVFVIRDNSCNSWIIKKPRRIPGLILLLMEAYSLFSTGITETYFRFKARVSNFTWPSTRL